MDSSETAHQKNLERERNNTFLFNQNAILKHSLAAFRKDLLTVRNKSDEYQEQLVCFYFLVVLIELFSGLVNDLTCSFLFFIMKIVFSNVSRQPVVKRITQATAMVNTVFSFASCQSKAIADNIAQEDTFIVICLAMFFNVVMLHILSSVTVFLFGGAVSSLVTAIGSVLVSHPLTACFFALLGFVGSVLFVDFVLLDRKLYKKIQESRPSFDGVKKLFQLFISEN